MANARKILIVDDDTDMRDALVEQLALHEEFDATAVDSGTKGVQAAKNGQVDLVIETELKPYDVLPLIPIVEGAGGVITSWENGRPHAGGRVIAAGDRRAHAQAMKLLKS